MGRHWAQNRARGLWEHGLWGAQCKDALRIDLRLRIQSTSSTPSLAELVADLPWELREQARRCSRSQRSSTPSKSATKRGEARQRPSTPRPSTRWKPSARIRSTLPQHRVELTMIRAFLHPIHNPERQAGRIVPKPSQRQS